MERDMSPPSSSNNSKSLIKLKTTQRGGRMIEKDGYEYHYSRKIKDGTDLWRCVKRGVKNFSCSAIIKTPTSFDLSSLTAVYESDHNHPPEDAASRRIKQEMELCIKTIENNPEQPVLAIYKNTLGRIRDTELDYVSKVPSFENIKNKLYGRRKKSLRARNSEQAFADCKNTSH